MPWPFSTHWYHKWNLLHFSRWSNISQKGWFTHQNKQKQCWRTCGTMTNDTALKTLHHKISLVLGTFRSEENSPGKNKLWRAIGWPLHKRSQRHKILQIAKEAHGLVDHSFFFQGGGIAGILPGTLPTYSIFWYSTSTSTWNFFLLEVMCKSSSVLWGTNQLGRFFCSVRNKPQFLSLCSAWVYTFSSSLTFSQTLFTFSCRET